MTTETVCKDIYIIVSIKYTLKNGVQGYIYIMVNILNVLRILKSKFPSHSTSWSPSSETATVTGFL